MSRSEKLLIDKERLSENFQKTKVIEVFPDWKDLPPNVTSAVIRFAKKWREIVLSAPTVDAVEVVRCKNCAYGREDLICTIPHCTKSFYGCPVSPEHYCSFGERISDA